jgi:hypothetical protein
MVLDDAECDEVGRHHDDCDDEGYCCDERREERAEETGTEGEEEGDECEAGGDWVEDHDARERFRGIGGGAVESRAVDLSHDQGRVVANALAGAPVLIGPVHAVSCLFSRARRGNLGTYWAGATSRTQWPKVPNVTEELRMSLLLVRVTFKMAISWMTGAEIVVIKRRIAEAKSRKVPVWWTKPVLCILTVFRFFRW